MFIAFYSTGVHFCKVVCLCCVCTIPLGSWRLQQIPSPSSLFLSLNKSSSFGLASSPYLGESLLDSLQYVNIFLEQAQNWMQHSSCGLPCATQKGRIPSFHLLAIQLLIPPKTWLTGTLLTHVQSVGHQDLEVCSCQAAFQPVLAYGVISS